MTRKERDALELSLLWWRRVLLSRLSARYIVGNGVRAWLECRHHQVLWGHEC